jgi:hypothetical protein
MLLASRRGSAPAIMGRPGRWSGTGRNTACLNPIRGTCPMRTGDRRRIPPRGVWSWLDPATQHSPAASSSSRMRPSSRSRRRARRSPYVIQSTGHGCGRNCAGSMAERRTDGAHGTREVSCCSCRDDFRPPRRSIGEDSPSKRIVVMARITGGYRRVGLPESPCTKETPCLKCRFIGTRSPRQYRCSPCAMPADEAFS